MPKIWRQGLIGGVDVIRNGDDEIISKIKLSDRLKRIELIGRHNQVGAFEPPDKGADSESLAEAMSKLADKLPD